ncbi:Putative CoA-transferase family III [Septoria linicola]|uniref:CoA-transferase family III n=1 Tax=Septoria linicola TaxID=215465 RepID=A0A9Q9ARD3_9PEZI|nr:Putative CoA-transferase family III [Septoria linicola]
MDSWPHSWNGQPDRSAYTTRDTIEHIWHGLGLPQDALARINVDLPSEGGIAIPSSFKIGHLAQASICLSALAASLVDHQVNDTLSEPQAIRVPLEHAVAEFGSEKHYLLDGKPAKSAWGTLGGLHKTADGHVRMHDNFPNHRNAICKVLELDSETATKEDVAEKTLQWKSAELETAALKNDAVIFALRSYQEWETSGPGQAIMAGHNLPIRLTKMAGSGANPTEAALHIRQNADRCLRGLRVLELSRVIAAPVAGKTLAAHGADVLWVTSPNLPSLPALDIDVGRGKRSIQLDIKTEDGKQDLEHLARDADVL